MSGLTGSDRRLDRDSVSQESTMERAPGEVRGEKQHGAFKITIATRKESQSVSHLPMHDS